MGHVVLKSRSRLSMAHALELRPRRAPDVECRAEGGETRLTVRRASGLIPGLVARLFHLPASKSFVLDRIGTRIWVRCDGVTPIRAIAESMASEEAWRKEQAERAVLQYLSTLSRRRLVGFTEESGP